MKICHASVEGAQHGPKGLMGFLDFAKGTSADGAQASNFMLEDPGKGFLPTAKIRQAFEDRGLRIDGFSAHCPFWVHTTAWTGSKTIRPFLPAEVASQSVEKIEEWAEAYLLHFLNLCAEVGVKVVPMFWGVAYGWEVATGYPWGFWSGADYDLIKEGHDRFRTKTQRLRDHARTLGIYLAHEIHPGTVVQTADDFLTLRRVCDNDSTMTVNFDPSHCWEGESWQTRLEKVEALIYGCHMKNHHVRPGHPLRCMVPDWPNRPMQFTQLAHGDIDLVRVTDELIRCGYVTRYREIHKSETAPLIVEAEGAFENLDEVSAKGIDYVFDHCCYEVAAGSFEAGMGAEKG